MLSSVSIPMRSGVSFGVILLSLNHSEMLPMRILFLRVYALKSL